MIITCPNCHTRFEVPDAALRPSGRKLKCANCGHIWFEAAPPGLPSDTPNLEHDSPQYPDSDKKSRLQRKTLADGFNTTRHQRGSTAEADCDTGTDGDFLQDQPDIPAKRLDDVDDTGEKSPFGKALDEIRDDIKPNPDRSNLVVDEDKSAQQWAYDGAAGTVTHGRKPARRIRYSSVLAGLAIILIAANIVWGLAYYFRSDIVRHFPAALDLYSKINVSVPSANDEILFQETVLWHGERDGHRVFEVSGTLYNPSETRVLTISAIRLQLLDGSDTVLQERDFPVPVQSLQPRQRVPFDISLVNPSDRRKSYRLQSVSRR